MGRRILIGMLLLHMAGCAELGSLLGQTVQQPRLTFQSARVESLSLDAVTVAATFRVENPNSFGLQVVRADYGFLLDGQKVFDGQLPEGLSLPASGTTTLPIQVRVPYNALPGALKTVLSQRTPPYQVNGTVTINTPVSDLAVPFSWSGTLPAPRLPL